MIILLSRRSLPLNVSGPMTTPAVSVPGSAEVAVAMTELVIHGLRSLPVVDADNHVIGMLSRGDVLRMLLTPDDTLAAEAQSRLDQYAGAGRWHVAVANGHLGVSGRFADESERRIAIALARTVPGVRTATIATTTTVH